MSPDEMRHAYSALCRPSVAGKLAALGLDVIYERASGDQLRYRDARGRSVVVTDFVGGYGSTILGHNPPAIVRAATETLIHKTPFATQGSVRSKAAALARRLHDTLLDRVGLQYAALLSSTGAEAVEIALKHAQLRFGDRADGLRAKLERELAGLGRGLEEGRYRLGPETARTLGLEAGASFLAIADAVRARFESALVGSRPVLFALERAFHGKTMGALALTHFADYRRSFERLLLPVQFLPANDIDALERALASSTVSLPWLHASSEGVIQARAHEEPTAIALFAEPIQGEGGVHPLTRDYAQSLRTLADRHRFTLVFDEIQCGMGRTGTFLYSEQLGVAPDVLLLSKSLGGGLVKISACCIRRDHVSDRLSLVHSSTFAEDDPSAIVALATLDALLASEASPVRKARDLGAVLARALRAARAKYPDILREVRGAGLMLGVELAPAEALAPGALRHLAEQQLLGYAVSSHLLHRHRLRVMPCISSPQTIRLEPSARMTRRSVRRLVRALESVCAILRAGDSFSLLSHLATDAPRKGIEVVAVERRPEIAPGINRRAGLVGYFVDVSQMPKIDRALVRFSQAERERLLARFWRELAPVRAGSAVIQSSRGDRVELVQYGLFVDSSTFAAGLRSAARPLLRSLVRQAAERARDEGCSVVAFGGLTSVVTGNCRDLFVPGIGLTTGNSLTVAMCLDAARREAGALGIDLSSSTVAVVGAGGNIGSVYSQSMADEAARVVLVARPGNESTLEPLAARLVARAYEQLTTEPSEPVGLSRALARDRRVRELLAARVPAEAAARELVRRSVGSLEGPVHITADLAALRVANVILGASNSARPLVLPEHLAPEGPVLVIDVAVPGDADPSLAGLAPRVKIVTGGTIDLGPLNRSFDPLTALPNGHLYACATEAVVLALECRVGDYGVGSIRPEQVSEMRALAHRHGFRLATGQHASALAPLRTEAR